MGQNRDQRDMGRGRNEAETGEPIQLNENEKHNQQSGQPRQGGQQAGQQHQSGGQQGGQHQGGQQQNRPSQVKPNDKQQKSA